MNIRQKVIKVRQRGYLSRNDLALQAGKVGLYATIDGSKGNEAWFKDFSCSKVE